MSPVVLPLKAGVRWWFALLPIVGPPEARVSGFVPTAGWYRRRRSSRQPAERCQSLRAADPHYTTLSRNAHRTEERELLYPWHPWAGRRVHVHEMVEKAGWAAFRCSLTGIASDRWLEVPVWMFDRVASQSWQLRTAPLASVAALAVLRALLSDAAEVCGDPSRSRDLSAASDSQKAIPGDVHATPTDTTTTRLVRRPLQSGAGRDAAMAEFARRGATDADQADGPPDPRARRRRGLPAEGSGT